MTTDITPRQGQPDSSKDSLIKDFKGIAGKADHLVREAGHSVAADLSARQHAISDKANHLVSTAHQYARDNPWTIGGFGVALGALIITLAGRR